MAPKPPTFQNLSACVALATLLGNTGLPLVPAAGAQPPQPAQTPPDQNRGDPPERVGRIAELSGELSWRTGADTGWSAAALNYPVSSGDAFWTEPSAVTGIEIAACRVVLAGGTEFDLTALGASGLQAVAAQGETYLHLRDLAPGEVWSVRTPRGLIRLLGPGRYAIVAGTTAQPTRLTVLDGIADIQGAGLWLQVTAGQTATIVGTESFLGSIGPVQGDAFLDARLAAERPPQPVAAAIPQQVAAMPGGAELIESGSWSAAPEYGQVWYPPVSAGWAPYRTATGPLSRPGAGPGSTMPPGASRRSTMAGGFSSTAAGPGPRAKRSSPDRPSTHRPWWRSSASAREWRWRPAPSAGCRLARTRSTIRDTAPRMPMSGR